LVDETGYVTVAEREIDWEEMKNSYPKILPDPTIPFYNRDHWCSKRPSPVCTTSRIIPNSGNGRSVPIGSIPMDLKVTLWERRTIPWCTSLWRMPLLTASGLEKDSSPKLNGNM
jgi:hypothetical protein